MNNPEVAINVNHVSKDFVLPHEKTNSLKSIFVHPFKAISSSTNTTKQHALKNISFEIKRGEFFGIVGRNGSGKSTLLKIIAGIYQPTRGSVHVDGRLVPFIELGVGFNPELTGRENVYLNGALMGYSKKEVDSMYEDIVAFAELEDFMDQRLKNYSSGMQVRLAFSVATRSKADVLLIDEVLAVGDADFQRKCFNYFRTLKKQKKTVIFVSHDMAAVKEFCDRALLIEKSEIIKIGNTELIAQKYAELFLADSIDDSIKQSDEKRWGNQYALINDVKIINNKKSFDIIYDISIKKPLPKVICGLHVLSDDGQEIIAINNNMIKSEVIKNAHTNDHYEASWNMENIFSDGDFTVTATLIDQDGTVLDWRAEIGTIKVRRVERSVTHILPPTKFIIHKKEN